MDSGRLARNARMVALAGVGGVVCLVLLPIAVNIATGGSAPKVLGRYTAWVWPALIGCCAVGAALAAWEPLRARLVQHLPAHPANRVVALDRVERFVRARVAGSLAAQVRLKLGVAPRVGPPLPTDPRVPLVVAGEPGSGKTTLLLELAEALLAAARGDPDRPLPVVVDLGAWRREADFDQWLLRELAARYRIGPRLGRAWLRERRLALLLDGLDEVAEADRVECLRRITALEPPQVVLCCGTDDCERLPRYDVVRVRPLRRAEVLALISACGPRLDGLREELTKNPELWQEVRTPLAFDLLALAYRAGRAEYRGVLDTYVVESVARQPRAERLLRALRFLARIAASPARRDLAAHPRLPRREVWLGFVAQEAVWRLFRRAAPGALAGAAAALCFVVGQRVGLVTAGVAVLCTALLHRGRFAAPARERARGARWAVVGFLGGAATTAGLSTVGGWLGANLGRWPAYLSFAVVVLVAFLLGLGGFRDGYWATACAVLPTAVMVLTGPSAELLVALGTGLSAGAATGVFLGGLTALWSGLPGGAQAGGGLRWLPVAGLAGAGLAAVLGAPVGPQALAPVTGLLIGLAVIPPAAARPLDAVTEALARPLALDEFPLRRRAVLRDARDRVLLVEVDGEHRFPHPLVRDHLAGRDPAELGAEVARRRAGIRPSGSAPRA
ncbi:NACHT domain-containing protein [Saccharothrix coeruleofusca]|uniref:NACHT domain-containing protein n=1 Tax=Saccharothrix coeruleofusca TaxID=33919 RepID=A0A918AKG3_9PSEU|nr:NACHT domain-containing protein [Saccharothrix coeruleofusca]GGP50290.1 hypothetical protein GCM10010185_23110 [Saccharothrix coeruleofusca]